MDALDVCDAFDDCGRCTVSQGAHIILFRHTLATLASSSRVRGHYDCSDSALHRFRAPAGEGQDAPRENQRGSVTLASRSMDSYPRSCQNRPSRGSEKGSRHCRQVPQRASASAMRGINACQISSLCKTHIIHFSNVSNQSIGVRATYQRSSCKSFAPSASLHLQISSTKDHHSYDEED